MAMSWSTALGKAIDYFIYSIIWDILGIVMLFLGINGLGLTNINSIPRLSSTSAIVPLILLIAGFLLLVLGNIATFIKILSDSVLDEMESRAKRRNDKEFSIYFENLKKEGLPKKERQQQTK